jgi:uncharacterized protein
MMSKRWYVSLWSFTMVGLLLAPANSARAQAVKDLPKPTDYVSDYAHVLSPVVTQQLDQLCGEVDHQAHAQIAVVTIETTGDEPINDYAVQLEDAWKVGPKGSDRGLIVLLAVKDRKRWIETGYGLEGVLPDAKVGQIGRAMAPYLQHGDYNGAVSMAVGQMAGIIAQDAGVTLQQPTPRMGRRPAQQVHLSLGQLVVVGVIAIFFLWITARMGLLPFLFGMLLGSSFGGGGGGGGGRDDDDSGGGSGFDGFGGGSTGGGGAGGDW